MARPINLAAILELVRFYQAALVNALFGFGLYALLIRLGLNIYVAQIVSHCIGAMFNYFTYRKHVFRDAEPAKLRFVLTYVFQYFLGLFLLFIFHYVIESPYLLGIVVLIVSSVVNYFALKYLVFAKRLLS